MNFDVTKILQVLPHRPPYLLLDRVTELHPGQSARGLKCVSANEPFFAGHFPGRPVMPGLMVVEALGQLSSLLAYVSEPFDVNQYALAFLGVNQAKFRQPVVPGDRLDLKVSVTQHRSNIWKTECEAKVDTVSVTQAELLFAVADRHSVMTSASSSSAPCPDSTAPSSRS